jgi:hypothetical protein
MSDRETTHLIFYDGHFHEAKKGAGGLRQRWFDSLGYPVCHVGKEKGCLPLADARRLFEEEANREPPPPAPTREKAIEAMACAHAALCGIDWDKQTVSGKMIWIHKNAEFYDALLAMGAIREG